MITTCLEHGHKNRNQYILAINRLHTQSWTKEKAAESYLRRYVSGCANKHLLLFLRNLRNGVALAAWLGILVLIIGLCHQNLSLFFSL